MPYVNVALNEELYERVKYLYDNWKGEEGDTKPSSIEALIEDLIDDVVDVWIEKKC